MSSHWQEYFLYACLIKVAARFRFCRVPLLRHAFQVMPARLFYFDHDKPQALCLLEMDQRLMRGKEKQMGSQKPRCLLFFPFFLHLFLFFWFLMVCYLFFIFCCQCSFLGIIRFHAHCILGFNFAVRSIESATIDFLSRAVETERERHLTLSHCGIILSQNLGIFSDVKLKVFSILVWVITYGLIHVWKSPYVMSFFNLI